MRDGLNFKFIPCAHEDEIFSCGGVNLFNAKQDLRQSYLTAKYIFRHAKSGTVKFVLIGDDKNIFSTTPEQADLNFDGLKAKFRKNFSAQAITEWKDDLKIWDEAAAEKNSGEEFLKNFRETIHRLETFQASPSSRRKFLRRVFEVSSQLIRHKEKIKLGFVVYLSAQWSGDDLYNFFINDKRFETTVFLCKRVSKSTDNELFQEDFLNGIEQFKSHNLNVVPVENRKTKIPPQEF